MTTSEIKKSSDLITGFYLFKNIFQGYFEPILVKNILTFLGGAFVKITKKIVDNFYGNPRKLHCFLFGKIYGAAGDCETHYKIRMILFHVNPMPLQVGY